MKSRSLMRLPLFGFAVLLGALLSACAVSPEGPVATGSSHGTLGSTNMSDYYYRKTAGWAYVFSNVEHIYNSDGTTTTLTGANDTVFTLGYDGLAPNGDSMYRYEISYRVLSSYAGRGQMSIPYISSIGNDDSHGAFVEPGYSVSGMQYFSHPIFPVSADTIVAGFVGEVRTHVDDFTNTGNYVWQRDTLWCTQHLDSTFIWEHWDRTGPIVKERCIFIRDFDVNPTNWVYDVINSPNFTTKCQVVNADFSYTGPTGTYDHTADIRIKTSEVDDINFNREYKYYACFTGPVYEYDWWYVTTDGLTSTKEDFVRTLQKIYQP